MEWLAGCSSLKADGIFFPPTWKKHRQHTCKRRPATATTPDRYTAIPLLWENPGNPGRDE